MMSLRKNQKYLFTTNIKSLFLQEEFSKFGRVHSCEILWDKQDRSTGEALIMFENPRAAEDAI